MAFISMHSGLMTHHGIERWLGGPRKRERGIPENHIINFNDSHLLGSSPLTLDDEGMKSESHIPLVEYLHV